MNTTEIILYIVLVILIFVISHIVYNYNTKVNIKVNIKTIESFGAADSSTDMPTLEPKGNTDNPYIIQSETTDTPSSSYNPDSSATTSNSSSGSGFSVPLPTLKCIAKLKLNSPLHGCNALTSFVSNKISNYNTIINDLKNVFNNLDSEIEKVKDKYGAIVDSKIDAYKVSEDTVRQQAYFKTQNGNVININTKYKDELSKKTDVSKETYNIQLDLFNKAKDQDSGLNDKNTSLVKYCKYTMTILIVILLLNLMVSEFND